MAVEVAGAGSVTGSHGGISGTNADAIGVGIKEAGDFMNDKSICTPLTEYPDLLTVANLAVIFQCSKQSIWKSIKQGKFGNPILIGKSYRIPKVYLLKNYFNV